MEYIYAALLLHKLGKSVDENGIMKILQSTGAEIDESKIKSLIASLRDVDIEAELANAVAVSIAPVGSAGETEAKSAEAPKEEKKSEAAEGLSALFG